MPCTEALWGSHNPAPGVPLRALTRMTVTSRYPLNDTPPLDLFDPADARLAIGIAEAAMHWVQQLDQLMELQP